MLVPLVINTGIALPQLTSSRCAKQGWPILGAKLKDRPLLERSWLEL
jgi:hypothetical protein